MDGVFVYYVIVLVKNVWKNLKDMLLEYVVF